MALVSIVLLVLFVIVALLMMLVVLIQDDQGEGIAGMFGGAGTTPMGSRSGNVLTRFTSILGALFLFGAFALAWLNRTPEASNLEAKARAEQLRQTQSTEWWVQKPATAAPQAGEPTAAEAPNQQQAAQAGAPSQQTAPAGAPSSLQR
jgi:preprotein translocase subunit SecG